MNGAKDLLYRCLAGITGGLGVGDYTELHNESDLRADGVAAPSYLAALFAIVGSWLLEWRTRFGLSELRRDVFRAGLIVSPVSLLLTASIWIDIYPYKSDLGLEMACISAGLTAVASTIFALFGRGWPRILLVVSGILTYVLADGWILLHGDCC